MMRLASKGDESLDWTNFRQMIAKLVPLNLEDQITLFLRAYVPKLLKGEDIDNYLFGKEDILTIAKECLEPLFQVTDDDFFLMLYTNYAKIIYKIIGLEWNQDPAKEEKKISLRRLKNSICKADGYERDMLTLMYGTTGIMELLEEKIHHSETVGGGGKIQLKDVSETNTEMNTSQTSYDNNFGRSFSTDFHNKMNSDLDVGFKMPVKL